MRVQVVKRVELTASGTVFDPLSPLDGSPLLLKTVNCASLRFSYAISFDRLQQATQLLLLELPILGGRLTPAPAATLAQHPYLQAAPYCIKTGPGPSASSGVVLCEAQADAGGDAATHLNQVLGGSTFSMTGSQVKLPPWFQPLDVGAMLKGKEPLLKLQLTHCSDGGCILAATMPHLQADSHSSTFLLQRLSELYRQLPATTEPQTSTEPQTFSAHICDTAAAAAAPATSDAAAASDAVVAAPSAPFAPSTAAAPASATTATADAFKPFPHQPPSPLKPFAQWSKSLLRPSAQPGSRLPTAKELQLLSLVPQSVEPPSLKSTLQWVKAAVSGAIAASKKFPGAASSLCSVVVSIPQEEVKALKALASATSTNDALSALVWVLFCDLRGRPLPGSSSTSSSNAGGRNSRGGSRGLFGCFGGVGAPSGNNNNKNTPAAAVAAAPGSSPGMLGLAVDLRQNCSSGSNGGSSGGSNGGSSGSSGRLLPVGYFGNAAWCLHVAGPEAAAARAAGAAAQASNASASHISSSHGSGGNSSINNTPHSGSSGGSNGGYVSSLSAAAAAVRGAVDGFRSVEGSGDLLLQLVAAQAAAPTSVLVRNLSRLAVQVDAFITSWRFPVAAVDFGGGPPCDYCCVVRPTPPWQAAVLPLLPADKGCARLLLTVPASAVGALRDSPVLRQLVPGAVVVGAG